MHCYKYFLLMAAVLLLSCAGPQVQDRSRFNDAASLTAADALPVNPLHWKAVNTFTDTVQHTQSTLYANDSAYQFIRNGLPGAYGPQARMALVTWAQRDDPHWLGARIAGEINSVELITFDKGPAPQYAHYVGHPLKAAASMSFGDSARLVYALKQPVLSVP